MPANVSYPETFSSPLRGPRPYAESERDVFFGRNTEIQEVTTMVTSDRFRAGLLYGESGVGKTSLLRAGLVPFLREQGVAALYCEDIRAPIHAFMRDLSIAVGAGPDENEAPIAYLTRTIANSVAGQLFIFILDHVEEILLDKQVTEEIGDLFARVVSRSGGRARFLFSCASDSIHRFTALEHRTGSLFPPSSRYELGRLGPAEAAMVLDHALALTGVSAEPQLGAAVVDMVTKGAPVLPLDIQLTVLALRECGIYSKAALAELHSARELDRRWVTSCAAATGNERNALRLLGELAQSHDNAPRPAEWLSARASVELGFTHHALGALAGRGFLTAIQTESGQPQYALAHAVLLPRVREITLPARLASQRAYELVGSKVESQARLSLREFRALYTEGITPVTPEERAVVERSKRFYLMIAGAIAAVPLVFLLIVYIALSGRYYFDIAKPASGGGERVVVRTGRPALSGFFWLPKSPDFGSIIADSGLTHTMVSGQTWSRIADHEVTGSIDDYGDAALSALTPTYRSLIEYASSGSPQALSVLYKEAQGPDAMIALLDLLRPIARGIPEEVELIEATLRDIAPSVQRSALALAASSAMRRDGSYAGTLAQALTAPDAELRQLAFAAASALGEDTARSLYRAALAKGPDTAARNDLLAALTELDAARTPSADSASSLLATADLPQNHREKARSQLKRAFATAPAEAARASAKLAANTKVPESERIFALGLLRDLAPKETYADIAGDVQAAMKAPEDAVRAAVLPLFARVAPKEAAAELALLFERRGELNDSLRVALALGWGELAKASEPAAANALETLLDDDKPEVRAAAAEAFGNVGRPAQDILIKMVKQERTDVAIGAAHGLANSAKVGASSSTATSGILQLWRRKGKQRRIAAEILAKMGRHDPVDVYPYLSVAARSPEDDGLHVPGVIGLCNASQTGHRKARRSLADAASNSAVEVRRIVIQCTVDTPGDPKNATEVAVELADDVDAEIRADAARVLARLLTEGKPTKPVMDSLIALARDSEREVRTIAVRALTTLGREAPEQAKQALVAAYERAGEAEKLGLLAAAQAIGASELVHLGIGDESPKVRIGAVDTAIALGQKDMSAISAGVTDADPAVRRATIARLSEHRDKLDGETVNKALRLAIRDSEPTIAELALTTLARVGSSDEISDRLRRDLDARSEETRARAAAACMGLVEHNPELALSLLTPLLDDPSHDVRVAMLPAIASAWAVKHSPEQLAALLRDAETHATKRLAATAAFLMLAQTEAGRESALAQLSAVAKDGAPLVRIYAAMGQGLIASAADGIEFLQKLVP